MYDVPFQFWWFMTLMIKNKNFDEIIFLALHLINSSIFVILYLIENIHILCELSQTPNK
jgi:hypothetical protein